jgi:HK97 family phage prohead protease
VTMKDVLYRVAPVDLMVRAGGDGRTISGIACPFGVTAEVSDGGPRYRETFVRGAFARTIRERGDRVRLMVSHERSKLPIGRATSLTEDAAGLVGDFRVSKTMQGDEVLELVRDGALDSLSVGFVPVADRRLPDGTVSRTEVALKEVSVVATPAYDGALILGVRSARTISAQTARRRLAILESRYR